MLSGRLPVLTESSVIVNGVLEKRANLLLQNQDAYVRAAGGVRLDEPAIDLAVAIAIASSIMIYKHDQQMLLLVKLG